MGQIWVPDACGFELRLDAVVGSALVVRFDRTTLQEAVLEGPSGRIRLRQDERMRVGDVSAVFLYEATAPVLRHTVTFYDLEAAQCGTTALESQGQIQFRGWSFAQGVPDPHTPETAVLVVTPRRRPILVPLGAALVLVGLCMLWLSRRSVTVPGHP